MAKETIVLAVEEKFLRALRLVPEGDGWKRAGEQAWPLVPQATEEAAPESAALPAAPEDFSADDAAPTASADDLLVAALRDAVKQYRTREFALALPLARLLVKPYAVPAEEAEGLPDAAAQAIASVSPFPDEELTVGFETLAETDTQICALAGALPEAGAAELGAAFDAAGVRITSTDALALGWLRALWPQLLEGADGVRRIVLLDPAGDGWDLAVLDGGVCQILRGLGPLADPADCVREITLSLLQCARFADVAEVVVASSAPPETALAEKLAAFGPVRHVPVADDFAGAEGAALRAVEGGALDATPARWTQALKDLRANRKLALGFAIAAGVWALAMGVLFGGPVVYDQMTARVKKEIRLHAKAYHEVKDMKSRVKLVQKYSDRARGALEVLKAAVDRMPAEGMTLTKFQYRRGEERDGESRSGASAWNLHLSGEAAQPTDVYAFKDALEKTPFGEDDRLFARVALKGPNGVKNKFDVEGFFLADEEDASAKAKPAAKRKGGL